MMCLCVLRPEGKCSNTELEGFSFPISLPHRKAGNGKIPATRSVSSSFSPGSYL